MKVVRKEVTSPFTLSINTPSGYRSYPAKVPGSVHTDLIASSVIGDIRIDGTEAEQEWIRNEDSRYTCVIDAEAKLVNHELNFKGLDTLATISINGVQCLQTENMHRSYSIDVSKEIIDSQLEMSIDFQAPLPEALKRQAEMGIYPNPYDMPYNYFRKMACSFGWDWGPITLTSGIWKPIFINSWDEGILDSVSYIPDVIQGVPVLRVMVQSRGTAKKLQIQISDSQGDFLQFEKELEQDFVLELPNLKIWHPRGFGEPNLYDVKVTLLNDLGDGVDEFSKRVGFRSVSLDRSSFDSSEMFAIMVNGQRVWARGVNWIPDDPFPHRVGKDEYRKRINDLFSVEVNAIRVWGGGIYESDDFYDLCDELGIIVWQDFLFACAAYPENQDMFHEITAEATEAVSRLSNHPSLVMWCGGNECIEGFQHWGWQERLDGKDWGLKYFMEILPSVLKINDGSRPYLPNSPFSFVHSDVKDFSSGTNHIWDVWNERGYQRYEEYKPSFAAEFGYNGPGSWRTLTRSIGKENLDSRDPDLATHQKAFDGMDKIAAGLKREFAIDLIEGPAWYFAAQLVQARAVEVGLKHFRSLYETCSGSMLWQYNDMWPAISWAVLDSSSSRKLSWYAMREAYRPRLIHFSTKDRDLVFINDTSDAWNDDLTVTLVSGLGEILETYTDRLTIDSRSQTKFHIENILKTNRLLTIDGFLVAQLGEIRVARRISDNPIEIINPMDCSISAQVEGNRVMVSILAKNFIFELSLLPELFALGEVTVSHEMRTLLPGESIKFEITCTQSTDAILVAENIDSLVWSLNRLMNETLVQK